MKDRFLMATGVMVGFLLVGALAHALEIQSPLSEAAIEIRILGSHELSHPTWMAVIADREEAQFLAGVGDPIFRGGGPRPVGVVRNAESDGLTVAPVGGGRPVRVIRSRPLPGGAGSHLS